MNPRSQERYRPISLINKVLQEALEFEFIRGRNTNVRCTPVDHTDNAVYIKNQPQKATNNRGKMSKEYTSPTQMVQMRDRQRKLITLLLTFVVRHQRKIYGIEVVNGFVVKVEPL